MTTPTPEGRIESAAVAERAVRWFPASLMTLALAAPAITWGSPYFPLMLSWSLLALALGLTLAAARPVTGTLPSGVSANGFAAMVFALEAGVLLLLVPVTFLVWRSPTDDLTGWTYPYLNKRWLVAVYGVAIVTFLVLPAAIRRLLPGADAGAPDAAAPDRRSWPAGAVGVGIVVSLVWLLAGPPWHAERHHRPIDFHEQVHLGPLQAISKGHLPFVGPASTQYGPGSQIFTYAAMQVTDRFTIVGFREANLAIHFMSLLAVGLLAWWLIDLPSAILIVVLSLACSPASFFTPLADGTLAGAYGWGNGFRYLGALLVVPALGLTASRKGSRVHSWRHVGLGVAWGLFAWISQENVTSTAAAAGLVLIILGLTATITTAQLMSAAASGIAGFVLFWFPVLSYYAVHGEAGHFIRNYFLVARAVAMGFSNTWWNEGAASPLYDAYRFTPLVVIVVGLATIWDLRRLELRRPLDRKQVRLLGFVAVLAACYLTALYRSDGSHVVNTLIALPFVLTLAFRDLASWSAASWIGRLAARALVIGGALFIYPLTPLLTDLYGVVIKPSLVRFRPMPDVPTVPDDPRVAFARATAHLSDEPSVAPGTVPMRQFLEEASALRDLIGARATYVSGLGSVYTGLLYFMADLTPAVYMLERETMTINGVLAQEVLQDLRGRIHDVECVVVREIEAHEARMFLEAHPGARVEQRQLAGAPVFVLLSPVTP